MTTAPDPTALGPDGLPRSVVPGERRPGLPLSALTHRLAAAPPALLDARVHPAAALADLAVSLDGTVLDAAWTAYLDGVLGVPGAAAPATAQPTPTTRAAPGLLAAWLLLGLHRTPPLAAQAQQVGGPAMLLVTVAPALVALLDGLREPRAWVADEPAREELARAFLAVCGLLPGGQDAAAAADAWSAVSTRHRRVVVAQMAEERRRAEELARRLAEQRAKEAAAQYANY